jgi:Tol biopolymer transport system component/DNA-binding winged helix-turn-helix (wHTH) protein
MAEKGPLDARIRFGAFEADLRTKELFKDGRRVALANQSFVALATLLERPGQLVSREELRQRLWPDNRVVEFDQGLNAIINRLRDALGSPGLIETLPRRGYRFTGTVQDEQDVEAPPRGPQRQRAPVYGLAIALCVLIAVATVLLSRGGHQEPGNPGNLKVTPLTSLVGREVSPGFSPKGDELVFAWNGAADAGGRFDLYSRGIDSERLLRITRDPALALHAAWAPGATRIALARTTDKDSGVYLATPEGGSERLLSATDFLNEPFMQLSWSPDGRQVAYATVDSDGWSHIYLVDVAGGQKRLLRKPPACADAGIPAFSPDGRWLAFACTTSVAVYDVDVTDLATGATRSLISLQGNPQGLAWVTGSDAVIVANDSDTDSGIWRVSLGGPSSRLLHSEGSLGPGVTVGARGIAFVRDSQVIDIWRADLTTPKSDNLISSTRTQLVPAYSPDGARIAFESTRSGSAEIWLADADGRNPVKLTSFNGPLTGAPSWCHDGRRIAFDSRASGASAIYVLDVFEARPRRLETSAENLSLPVWSPDCRWIIAGNGRTTLYRVPASGGPAEKLTEKRTYRAFVPDSRVIFNVAGDSGVELWSKPIDGGVETPLMGMVRLRYSDGWTATFRGIYYTSSGARSSVVNFYDFATHQTHIVRALEGQPVALGGLGLSVSADEHWLLYTRSERSEGDILLIQPGQ